MADGRVVGQDRRRLVAVLGAALSLRVAAAVAITWWVARLGKPCVFADTAIYVELARTIRTGEVYRVDQWGVPHYALRTPGYPIFLAGCRLLFGPSLGAVRLVQAALGVAVVVLVGRLTQAVEPESTHTSRWGWSASGMAVLLAAVEPGAVVASVLVLSEAVFVPLMMASLVGLATLWTAPGDDPPTLVRRPTVGAIATGLASGGAILARPSWALAVPVFLLLWVALAGRGHRVAAARRASLIALATAVVLAPWWVRNARVVGRFVPTALWVGASLTDGLRPDADGSSDMRFVDAPDVRSLGEVEQDRVLRDRAWAFACEQPGRVVTLAGQKLARFWSPWPNADALRNPGLAVASSLATLPVFALVALGVWERRGDSRTLVLLLGPLLYFCALHLIFVSSIRYRIPGLIPALGLAGIGLARLGQGRPRLAPDQRDLDLDLDSSPHAGHVPPSGKEAPSR